VSVFLFELCNKSENLQPKEEISSTPLALYGPQRKRGAHSGYSMFVIDGV